MKPATKAELLISLLIKLGIINDKYHGTIILKFQNGKFVNGVKKNSFKL